MTLSLTVLCLVNESSFSFKNYYGLAFIAEIKNNPHQTAWKMWFPENLQDLGMKTRKGSDYPNTYQRQLPFASALQIPMATNTSVAHSNQNQAQIESLSGGGFGRRSEKDTALETGTDESVSLPRREAGRYVPRYLTLCGLWMSWRAFLSVAQRVLFSTTSPQRCPYTYINYTVLNVILAGGLDTLLGLEWSRSDFTENMAIECDSHAYRGHKIETRVQVYLA